jgi:hypothetical protein
MSSVSTCPAEARRNQTIQLPAAETGSVSMSLELGSESAPPQRAGIHLFLLTTKLRFNMMVENIIQSLDGPPGS